jgi:uncharacterized protein YggU (UPF0235/DUF167 family)
VRINIIAKTKAKKNRVVELTDTVYEVFVTASPVAGKANLAIVDTLATHFNVHKNQVMILSGFTSQNKVVEVSL